MSKVIESTVEGKGESKGKEPKGTGKEPKGTEKKNHETNRKPGKRFTIAAQARTGDDRMTDMEMNLMGFSDKDPDPSYRLVETRASPCVDECTSCMTQWLFRENFTFNQPRAFVPPPTLDEICGIIAARSGFAKTSSESEALREAFNSCITRSKLLPTDKKALTFFYERASAAANKKSDGNNGLRAHHADCERLRTMVAKVELEVSHICRGNPDDGNEDAVDALLSMRTAIPKCDGEAKTMTAAGLGASSTTLAVASGSGRRALRRAHKTAESASAKSASAKSRKQPISDAAAAEDDDDDGDDGLTRRAEVAKVAAMTGMPANGKIAVFGGPNKMQTFIDLVAETDMSNPQDQWPGLHAAAANARVHIAGDAYDESRKFIAVAVETVHQGLDTNPELVARTVFNAHVPQDPVYARFPTPTAFLRDALAANRKDELDTLKALLDAGNVDPKSVANMVAAAIGPDGLGQWLSNLVNTALAILSTLEPPSPGGGGVAAMAAVAETAPTSEGAKARGQGVGEDNDSVSDRKQYNASTDEVGTDTDEVGTENADSMELDDDTEDNAEAKAKADRRAVDAAAADLAAKDSAKAAEQEQLAAEAEAKRQRLATEAIQQQTAAAEAERQRQAAAAAAAQAVAQAPTSTFGTGVGPTVSLAEAAAQASSSQKDSRNLRSKKAAVAAQKATVAAQKASDAATDNAATLQEAAVDKNVTNAAGSSGRARSVSVSSSSSGSSRVSTRVTEQKRLAAAEVAHFEIISTKVRPTTTGTDAINNGRVNALTTVVPVETGDVILEMILPCAQCTPTQPADYDTVYETTYGYGQPSIVFCAPGGNWYAELIGPPGPECPREPKISVLYYANDASAAVSAGAEVKIELVNETTCRVIMTATGSAPSGSEMLWKYANSYRTLARPTSYKTGTQRRPPIYTEQPLESLSALVRASGAEVMELPLSLEMLPGTGSCFYSMLLVHLHHRGGWKNIKNVKQLRKRLRDYLLEKSAAVVQGFNNWLGSGVDGEIPQGLQTYRDARVAYTLEEYAQRVAISGNYANAFDILHILRLFELNLGTFVYTPNGHGYDVTPEVTGSGDASWRMIFCLYYRMGEDENPNNHYDVMMPLEGRQAEKLLSGDHITITFLGVLPQPLSSDIASAANVTTTTTTAPAEPPSSDIASAADVTTTTEPPSSDIASAATSAANPCPTAQAELSASVRGRNRKGKAKRKASPAPGDEGPPWRDHFGARDGTQDDGEIARRFSKRLNSRADRDQTHGDGEVARQLAAALHIQLVAADKAQIATDASEAKRLAAEEAAGGGARSSKSRRAAGAKKGAG